MNKVRLALLLLAAVLISPLAQASGDGEFRGIVWGTDLSAHPEMRRLACEEDHTCSFARNREELGLDGALLSSVTYHTFKGRFTEVILEAPAELENGRKAGPESANYQALLRYCRESYGPTSFASTFDTFRAEQYRWEQTGVRKVLQVNFNKNTLKLSIRDHDLIKGLKAASDDEPATGVAPSEAGLTGQGEATSAPSGATGGLKRLGGFLRWLFVTDEPAVDPTLEQP